MAEIDLPRRILENIFSLLPIHDAAQIILVSKAWQEAFASIPILEFELGTRGLSSDNYLKKFIKFANYCLKFRSRDSKIEKMKLRMYYIEELVKAIDLCLGVAVNSNVEELHLSLQRYGRPCYHLPPPLLASNTIRVLKLDHCIFTGNINLPRLHSLSLSDCELVESENINLPRLQELRLLDMHFDEQMVDKLLSSCPSMVNMEIEYCSCLKRLRISGLVKLELLRIQSDYSEGIDVEIEAPNLVNFEWRTKAGGVILKECESVKTVFLEGEGITDKVFRNVISRTPGVETLNLKNCNTSERSQISNRQLEELTTQSCMSFTESKIITSNLSSFTYIGAKKALLPVISSMDAPNLRQVSLRFCRDDKEYNDCLFWLSMRDFFRNFDDSGSL